MNDLTREDWNEMCAGANEGLEKMSPERQQQGKTLALMLMNMVDVVDVMDRSQAVDVLGNGFTMALLECFRQYETCPSSVSTGELLTLAYVVGNAQKAIVNLNL